MKRIGCRVLVCVLVLVALAALVMRAFGEPEGAEEYDEGFYPPEW